jgi:glutamine amidotransferase
MLAVIDYGLGNLRSICAALERLEVEFVCTSEAARIREAAALILPGVGAFPDGMRNLRELGLIDLLNDLVLEQKRPVLGICLGFQLMAAEGEEFGRVDGLGWLQARVVRMPAGDQIRIPHMGWNDCNRVKPSPLFTDIGEGELFYFTHSYHVECADSSDVVAHSTHGQPFVAAVQRDHIFGTQFHPEKSQWQGLSLLRNFATRVVPGC